MAKFLNRFFKKSSQSVKMPFIKSEQLKKLFLNAQLQILDIGARRGPLLEWAILAPMSQLFICEPDTTEAKKIKDQLDAAQQWRHVTVITEALAARRGQAILNMTRQPGLSSLLEPNLEQINQFYGGLKEQALDQWQIDKKLSVPALTLDEVAQRYGADNLALIKLDTQGTELEILKSGLSSALPGAVAVNIEMELLPFYKGQPLFTEIQNFLNTQGLRLINLEPATLRRQTIQKIPYAKRELVWVHALYFREHTNTGQPLSLGQLIKLSCIAIGLEYFDYALQLFHKPALRAYLHAQEFSNLEKELINYAAAVWRAKKRRLSSQEQKRLLKFSNKNKTI